MAYATDLHTNGRQTQNPGGFFARINAVLSAIAENRAKAQIYNTTRRELQSLAPRELDDLGIAPGDIDTIAREAAYGK